MRYLRIIWHTALFLLDRLVDWLGRKIRVIRHESDLFLGIALASVGLLHIHIGRFCDGNSSDYLSCTRPAVFYYYSAVEIVLVTLGIFLIVIWMLSRRKE
jgi:hypothetical protein